MIRKTRKRNPHSDFIYDLNDIVTIWNPKINLFEIEGKGYDMDDILIALYWYARDNYRRESTKDNENSMDSDLFIIMNKIGTKYRPGAGIRRAKDEGEDIEEIMRIFEGAKKNPRRKRNPSIERLAELVKDWNPKVDLIKIKEKFDADDADVMIGLHWFASDYHEGQWSDLYKILSETSRIYRPGPRIRSAKDEGEIPEMVYKEIERTVKRKNPRKKTAKKTVKKISKRKKNPSKYEADIYLIDHTDPSYGYRVEIKENGRRVVNVKEDESGRPLDTIEKAARVIVRYGKEHS